ncbi:MAG: DUF3887 domain-containing protein [Dehalococcoidales bacterium]
MHRKNLRTALACLTIILLLFLNAGISGCSAATTSVNTPVVQSAVEPIVTNILTSLNNNDYVGFSQNFSQTMKNAINQSAFAKLYSQMQSDVGDYQTIIFYSAANKAGLMNLVYFAQFSKEPAGVSVSLSVQSVNGAYQVQGLVFTSPNLAGKPIDVSQLRAYADAKIGNALVSLQNNDYAGFTEDFNQEMKNAMTQSAFTKLYNLISSTVGDYQSKEFEIAATANNIFTIQYYAQYSQEPAGVWVSISFDSNQKISGLYFNSQKLAHSPVQ